VRDGRKIGFAARRSVGNSPCRHRHIRKLREFYRLNKDLWPPTGHLFLLVRNPVTDWESFQERLTKVLGELPRNRPMPTSGPVEG
jgi:RNase P protein component